MTYTRTPSDQRRERRVEIRLTAAEETALLTAAKEAGLSVSDYIRKRSLDSRPLRQGATPERAAMIQALAGLGKIGSNVNQIAKALNTDLAKGIAPNVSGDNISTTLFALQTLSKHLLKRLTDGNPR